MGKQKDGENRVRRRPAPALVEAPGLVDVDGGPEALWVHSELPIGPSVDVRGEQLASNDGGFGGAADHNLARANGVALSLDRVVAVHQAKLAEEARDDGPDGAAHEAEVDHIAHDLRDHQGAHDATAGGHVAQPAVAVGRAGGGLREVRRAWPEQVKEPRVGDDEHEANADGGVVARVALLEDELDDDQADDEQDQADADVVDDREDSGEDARHQQDEEDDAVENRVAGPRADPLVADVPNVHRRGEGGAKDCADAGAKAVGKHRLSHVVRVAEGRGGVDVLDGLYE
mmetsp:Transcript_3828/g.8675  ORF Transcript_3828/g.8675 Transcript_3828/m.8675 type:complete len:287 (-) Transcript_3828:810-1670(-)